MSTNQLVIDDETLNIMAWVCYIQSMKGRSSLRVTDEPNWVSESQKQIYLRYAHEIVAAVEGHRKPVEGAGEPERLITSADVNNASAAKANALWGGAQ